MRKIKKILIALVITALTGNFLLSMADTAQAFDPGSDRDWGKAIGELFGGGGAETLSFTSYEGGLAELSTEGYDSSLTSSTDLKQFVLKVVNYALGFLGLIAVLVVIYAGVSYIISGGEDEKTGKAKKMIGYAAIGLLIVLGSFAFVNTIIKSALVGDGNKGGNTGTFGKFYGFGFNAIAEEVKGIASDIYTGYIFLADTTESFKNIKNDLEKTSLQRTSLPTKATVSNFLFEVQTELSQIKARAGHLTEVEAAVNDRLRIIETKMDKLNSMKSPDKESYVKVKDDGSDIEPCDPQAANFMEGLAEGYMGVERCVVLGFSYRNGGLKFFDEWDAFKAELNFDDIVPLLGKNYENNLKKDLDRLMEINDSISSISAVGSERSKANKYFEEMLGLGSAGSYGGKYGELLKAAESWTATSDIDDVAKSSLIPGLQAHNKYYEELKNLKFVKAKIRADITEGNAPLTVIFDTGDSEDPAGGSIDGHNIIWDPAGTQTVAGVLSSLPKLKNGAIDPSSLNKTTERGKQGPGKPDTKDKNMIVPTEPNVMECDNPADAGKDISYIGRRCTFRKPGTYLATVIINSNDQGNVGPGVSVIKITANPPTTKINLVATPQGGNQKVIMQYQNETLTQEQDAVAVTVDQAKNMTFDALGSLPTPQSYKWDFGNGKVTEYSASFGKVGPENYGQYKSGSYQVILEVMSENGVADRKIFTLRVQSIAASGEAKIDQKTDGEEVFVGSKITFDGSGSSVSKGNQITNYKWEVFKATDRGRNTTTGEALNKNTPYSGPAKKTFQYTFDKAGDYVVQLTITGADNVTDTAKIPMHVKSRNPQAIFDSETPDRAQPGTVRLKNSSLDPDNTPEELLWTWNITPAQKNVEGKTGLKNWILLNGDVSGSGEIKGLKEPVIKFNERGDYEVKLTVNVKDIKPEEEFATLTKKVVIDKTLDIAWDNTRQKVATKINEDMSFYLISDNAMGYEINFGDGETTSGDVFPQEGVKHQYKQSGKYVVEASVFDSEDNSNSIKKKVLVSGGKNPVAYATAEVNGQEVLDNTKSIEITKADKLMFTGAKSINTDGTGRKLKYSWDFGDSTKSSLKEAQHAYSELSPKDKGYYEVKLKVIDENDASKTSEDDMQVNVCPAPPRFSSVDIKSQKPGADPLTPVIIDTRVLGTVDPDGNKISKYRWWYFDTAKPEEELGMQVTNEQVAQLILGAKGESGAKIEYGIGLEITDSDGLIYCNVKTCGGAMASSYSQYPTCEYLKMLADRGVTDNYPTIRVTNENNVLPQAKFNVDKVKAFTGDEIKFTSSSVDADGQIKSYIWDFEGNGFYDNTPTAESSVPYSYSRKNLEGYKAKLKVIDDKGGESISEPVTVYIDSLAKSPTAAFKTEVVPGTNGKKIRFVNDSKPDETSGAQIIKYSWDFDLDTDSDGDGNKTNDMDSNVKTPEYTYSGDGIYRTKLSIVDSQGNKDEVTSEVKIPLAFAPVAAFTCELNNNIITCHDTSVADTAGKAEITYIAWDFDTTSALKTADSNGDGKKDNDEDAVTKDATYTYSASGTYALKLTVKDNQKNITEVTKDISVSMTGGKSIITARSTDRQWSGSGINKGISTDDTETPKVDNTPKIDPIKPILAITILNVDGKTIKTPTPDQEGIIYLSDPKEMVIFNFIGSTGPIAYYTIDKNIFFDSNGDGVKDNDEDYKTNMKGTYQTSFDSQFKTNTVKFTVEDIYGNKQSATQTIKFK